MVRGAATNGDFAHCRDHGRHNDRRGGKWRTRHAAPGIKTSCRTTARKGFDIAEGGAVAVRGRGGGGGVETIAERVQRKGLGNQGAAGSCLCGCAAQRRMKTARRPMEALSITVTPGVATINAAAEFTATVPAGGTTASARRLKRFCGASGAYERAHCAAAAAAPRRRDASSLAVAVLATI